MRLKVFKFLLALVVILGAFLLSFTTPTRQTGTIIVFPNPPAFPTPTIVVALAPIPAPAMDNCLVSSKFPDNVRRWCELIVSYANQFGVDPNLIAAMIWQESGGDPQAYSISGAVGLMQVMPRDGTAAEFICKNGPCFADRPTAKELQDPEFNIKFGTKMISDLYRIYGDLPNALKAYGPINVGYYYANKILGILNNIGEQNE